MIGMVLCGGKSIRMGTDKGLLQPRGQYYVWAQTAAAKLSSLSMPVFLSVNRDQFTAYCSIFSPAQLISDNETLSINGPLHGLLSVHRQHPSEDIFVLACDMPFMSSEILHDLLKRSLQEPGKDAFIFADNHEPEPLCGIYSAKGLGYISALNQKGNLQKHSMKYMLEQLNTLQVPIPAGNKKFFQNMNTHAALNGM